MGLVKQRVFKISLLAIEVSYVCSSSSQSFEEECCEPTASFLTLKVWTKLTRATVNLLKKL